MERWSNRVAIVTGAGSGIGAACVKSLLSNHVIVAGLDIHNEQMENGIKSGLSEELQSRFYPIRCDLRSETDIHNAFAIVNEQLGGVDILINSAGIVRPKTQIVDQNNTAILKEIIDVNLTAVALCTREAYQSIKRRNAEGHVIMINSILGRRIIQIPLVNWNIYPSTKHALSALTEVLRHEFLHQQAKIKITSICPGAVRTSMLPNIDDYIVEMPTIRPEDVADAAMYCLSTPFNIQIREIIVEPFAQSL